MIVQDYRTLFRFFLACTFAEPHHLGFDPTMTIAETSGGHLQYDLAVRSDDGEVQVYRTSRVLFDGGLDNPFGKGTRVWEAFLVDPDSGETTGEPVVLKDSWVGRHREREGNILARIRQSASSLNEADRAALESALISVVHHGDVLVSANADCTRALPHEGIKSFGNLCRTVHVPPIQSHYRIVYRELCRPLRTETCIASVFSAVRDVCHSKSNSGATYRLPYTQLLQFSHYSTIVAGSMATSPPITSFSTTKARSSSQILNVLGGTAR